MLLCVGWVDMVGYIWIVVGWWREYICIMTKIQQCKHFFSNSNGQKSNWRNRSMRVASSKYRANIYRAEAAAGVVSGKAPQPIQAPHPIPPQRCAPTSEVRHHPLKTFSCLYWLRIAMKSKRHTYLSIWGEALPSHYPDSSLPFWSVTPEVGIYKKKTRK